MPHPLGLAIKQNEQTRILRTPRDRHPQDDPDFRKRTPYNPPPQPISGNRPIDSTPARLSHCWRVPAPLCAGKFMAENNRCVSNGDQVSRVAALAMTPARASIFTGYWQRCGMSYPTLRRCFFATMGRWITDCARKTQRPYSPPQILLQCLSAAAPHEGEGEGWEKVLQAQAALLGPGQ